MRYVCSICGYVFDEEVEGTPFSELPDTWTCPLCGAAKSAFEPERAAGDGLPFDKFEIRRLFCVQAGDKALGRDGRDVLLPRQKAYISDYI